MLMDSTSSNFLAANNEMQKGASDPGDNPLEEPIPVGEGWWLLLMFSAVYAMFKTKHTLLKTPSKEL